jgi:cysteine sulfinate desulfinase/cysteine desulfurase-like protein
LKITHDARKRKLEEDLRKFVGDMERITEQDQRMYLRLIAARLTIVINSKHGEATILKLSDRGIGILRSLACISGEKELVNELVLEGRAKSTEMSVAFWLKVRNVLSRWLG